MTTAAVVGRGILGAIDQVRPLLRRDVVLLRQDDGVLLHSEHSVARLVGANAYPLLTRLRPHLTGRQTVGQLCAGLTDPTSTRVRELVVELLGRGLVIDVEVHGTEPQFGFLAHHGDAPTERLARFRQARILVTGNGPAAAAARHGLLRNGAQRVEPEPAGHAYDLVVACPGDTAARPDGTPVLPLARYGPWAVLGPVAAHHNDFRACCVRSALGVPDDGEPSVEWTPMVAKMLGAAAAFEAFRFLTGLTDGGTITVQHLRTLRATTVASLAGCPQCRGEPGVTARPPAAAAIRTVDDGGGTEVGDYARAVHDFARNPLPPRDFRPDWADRPPLFPCHDSGPLLPLDDDAPPGTGPYGERDGAGGELDLGSLGRLLRWSYGVRNRRLRFDSTQSSVYTERYPSAVWQRGAVSGGGLYPLKIYLVAGPRGAVPPGVHHYSPGHHAFEQLSGGDHTATVRAALGQHPDAARTDQFLVVSLEFWRNEFKYGNLGYHIATIDVGAFLATLAEVGRGIDVSLRSLLWFDDTALASVLGTADDETVLAAVPLPWRHENAAPATVSVDRRPSPVRASRTVVRFGWSQRVHRGIVLDQRERPAPVMPTAELAAEPATGTPAGVVPLPEPIPPREPVAALLHRRRSSFGAFLASPALPARTLSTILHLTARHRRQRTDVLADEAPLGWTGLSVLVNNVRGIAQGGYRYDPTAQILRRTGPVLSPAQWSATIAAIARELRNYGLDQAGAVLVFTGRPDAMVERFGPRGYRLLNAEVGQAVQAGYLAASATGTGCGAVLNLVHPVIDDVLGHTGTGERAILCLMVGGEVDGGAEFVGYLD
jgi:SagB-type dehydrogenase family enzyme